MEATEGWEVDIVKLLLEAGADTETKNVVNTEPPINDSFLPYKSIKSAGSILEHLSMLPSIILQVGSTALMYASLKGFGDLVEIFLKAGADIESKDKARIL